MHYTKTSKGKYKSPSGKKMSKKQVNAYYAKKKKKGRK